MTGSNLLRRASASAARAVPIAATILCAAPASAAEDCQSASHATAAAANAAELDTLSFAPFGSNETGWRMYAPLLGRAAGTQCHPSTSGFAAKLEKLQRRLGLTGDGRFTPATWTAVYQRMQASRPLVGRIRQGCPPPPAADALVTLSPQDSYGKTVQLTRGAADALRRLREAAARNPTLRHDRRLFTVYSGYRAPDYDAGRCAAQGNCDGRRRATCSPHRTGEAMDLYLGYTPPDATQWIHRRAMAATPAYAWLVANAPRFGLVNYAFEPWHWEWTGGR